MKKRKRQQNIATDYRNRSNKKKLQRTSSCFVTAIATDNVSVTHIEDLSNEVIYEIFEFLDPYHLYEGFLDLNTRFRNLCIHSNFPLQINNPFLSKSAFQHYYNKFIMFNKHRIQSLIFSDPFEIDFFSSSTEDISKCSALQSLVLDDIESFCLENLLNRLYSLSNLSSLTIHFGNDSDKINICHLIFRLPSLKYCKISFDDTIRLKPASLPTDVSSSIEHLVIIGRCYFIQLNAFLSYLPQLRRLLVNGLIGIDNQWNKNCSLFLNNLTSVSLTFKSIVLHCFEKFVKDHFHQVQVLYISINTILNNSNGNDWEQLILSHLPYLRIFDLQEVTDLDGNKINRLHRLISDTFSTPFWFQRQWLFSNECKSENCNNFRGILYSTKPYRRKYFILSNNLYADKDTCPETAVFDSVRHVVIEDEKMILNCAKYFPNVNELTLSNNCSLRSNWFATDNFHRLLPLSQLIKLTIDISRCYFDEIFSILSFMPNIHTLIVQSIRPVERDPVTLQAKRNFHAISNQNKIKTLTIRGDYSLKQVKILFNLCPELRKLTIGTSLQSLEPTIRFFLSENDEIPCHLSSLCIRRVDTACAERLKTLIKSIKVIDNYSTKIIGRKFYLWW